MKGNVFTFRSWSPYIVGTLIGILSWFSFASANKPLGITAAFEHTAALTAKLSNPAATANHAYFLDSEKSEKLKIDWEWTLVLGVFLGGLLSSRLSGDRPACVFRRKWAGVPV